MNDTQKLYVKTDATTAVTPVASPFVTTTVSDVVKTLAVGAIVGVISTGLYYVLNRYIFGAALCRSGVEGCENAPVYATLIATVVGIMVGIVALAKAGTYRPLPVAIAVGIAMSGLFVLMNGGVWYWNLLVGAGLFGLAYAVFSWLARVRSFILSIILLVVTTVVVRLVIG